ncbi:hypothetical protein [Microcoleus sp. bin38.metabat.b11b12b14.051]|uniref:hypothetical protein n=1 Tax=Microcoleus sp. bin38.metabat.b11b12b14.051 TaxID=2742709 RepID=UPI0025E01A36|nr:hypothetical protein [Microcoleus sp. bin38.metabat.b11b12b14.051]
MSYLSSYNVGAIAIEMVSGSHTASQKLALLKKHYKFGMLQSLETDLMTNSH